MSHPGQGILVIGGAADQQPVEVFPEPEREVSQMACRVMSLPYGMLCCKEFHS